MTAYYNEIDPFAAAWLRELIKAGHIAPGDVDERSIEDVVPADLLGYTQCHFFAGIGVWSYALRAAGWSDNRPVWTGSCPCQPFSQAGKGKGVADERHLWPAFFHLIEICGPDVVLGEQVAGKDGLGWLDLVSTDLEAVGYACGAVPAPAAGFGAPHIRERLYWMAHANGGQPGKAGAIQPSGKYGLQPEGRGDVRQARRGARPEPIWLGDADDSGPQGRLGVRERADQRAAGPRVLVGGLAHAPSGGQSGRGRTGREDGSKAIYDRRENRTCATDGFWRDADWLGCRDERWRPVEPGTFPLAHGSAARVGRLRGYGNAIVAPQAEAFVTAAIQALEQA